MLYENTTGLANIVIIADIDDEATLDLIEELKQRGYLI
jgi:hypothetical protein